MVWLAKWIRENVPNSRVLIITDRIELDEQIEKVFTGVQEDIHRTKSGADHRRRQKARDEERADRQRRDRAEYQHGNAGGHRLAHDGGGREDRRGSLHVVAFFPEHVAHDQADGGDIRRLRA